VLKIDLKTQTVMQEGLVKDAKASILSIQYAALCEQVQIPKEEMMAVDDLLKRLENLKPTITISRPNCVKMTLFRHWYLGLRNAVSPHLLIYDQHKVFRDDQIISRIDFASSSIKPLKWKSEEEGRHSFLDEKSGLIFELVSSTQVYHEEVETCRLAKYLVEFDPRAMSLLTLIHFWARENGITLASIENTAADIPDPGGLEWLCLFFLVKEGIIPTPLEIINCPHPNGRSMGPTRKSYQEDKDFVQEWMGRKGQDLPPEGTDEYIKLVLELTRAFFKFYTGNNFKGSVLKTREAKVVSAAHFFKVGRLGNWIKLDKIYLEQPIYHGRYFSICQDKFENVVQPLMEKSLEKIDKYLKKIENNQEHLNMNLKSLFQSSVKMEKVEEFPFMDDVKPEKFEKKDIKKEKPDEQTVQDVKREEPEEPELHDIKSEKPEEQEVQYIKKENAEVDDVSVFPNLMDVRCGCDGASTCSDESSLIHLFTTVCREVVYSTSEQKALHEVERLVKIFLERFGFPSCQVILFRNQFWKTLKGEEDLCVFIDHGAGKKSVHNLIKV